MKRPEIRTMSTLLKSCWRILLPIIVSLPAVSVAAANRIQPFVEKHCVECHDAETQKGGLDLTTLKFAPANSTNFARWVLVHDRVAAGEMPPKKKARPEPDELKGFVDSLASSLRQADRQRIAREGRATQRRLNRYEYENALQDLLHAPWLQIKDSLPEDGEAFRFNKVGERLDVSHVQMARYLHAADYALHQAMAPQAIRPETRTVRYYARDQRSYTGPMKFSVFNTAPERATFPVLGFQAQPEVRAGKAPITVGKTNEELRELEGVGVVASAYEPIEPKFNSFRAPVAGRYKLRFNGYTVWVGPGLSNKWFIPNLDDVSKGRRSEPVTIYSETPPRLLRRLGEFDLTPEPSVNELDVWLLAGETIRPDAARLFRSRPGATRWQNPLAEKDGQPGVVFRWLEVEGPIYDQWPPAGHQLMFGNLAMIDHKPAVANEKASPETNRFARFVPPAGVDVVSKKPLADGARLLRQFAQTAYRRPVGEKELKRFLPVIERALKTGNSFTEAMLAAYTAVLCSPEFVYLEEKPGRLDGYALASRLSFFLWNSSPDAELRRLAASGDLRHPAVLRAQADRLLNDPKSQRFVNAFLDYWLDLRHIAATAPDSALYSDYYLDDLLEESALRETRAFFSELLGKDLPVRNIIDSDFAMLNERLALHYGLPAKEGASLRRVSLTKETVRGGLLTQTSVLKVTANGTTTSPVTRGAWIMERILGQKPPPPPPNLPAIEPDIRGATTIREQLEKHRTLETCNACHAKIDPPGFALENFDVMGGWRARYRAVGDEEPVKGIAKSGQKFAFHLGMPVDASGQMPDGRKFSDVREFKRLLLTQEKQVARNFAQQLTVYATGAPVGFGDRVELDRILDRAAAKNFGVRTLVQELVQSDLFLNK
jgi:hypothetical protein